MSTKSNPHGIKVGQTLYLRYYNGSIKDVKATRVGKKYFNIDFDDMKINLSNLIPSDWPMYTYYKIYITKEDAEIDSEKEGLIQKLNLFFGTTKAKSLSIDVLREIKKLAGI